MSEYSDVIQGMFSNGPRAQVTSNINVNPDDSARAYDLEKATGTPASIISGDIDSFESQHKAAVAGDIVAGNPYIADYVNSHPLASQVSNDDYGTLDTISQHLQGLPRANAIYQSLKGVIGSYAKDFGPDAWKDVTEDEFKNHPIRASAQAALTTGISAVGTTLNAPFQFATDNIGRIARAITGSEQVGEDVSEKVAGLFEAGTMALVSAGLPIPEIHASALIRSLPWLKDGKVPPAGIDPQIDALKLKSNQESLKILDEAVKESQSSTTKERAPDLFKNFVEQHVQDARMGVSGQRALELYGDKTPAPDDGILGWVPNIAEQLEVAKDTGADISIPIKDYVANIDPAIHKELHDDLRPAEGGITNREAAEALPPVSSVDEAVPVLRNNAGLEPMFSIGDRKLTLQRMAEKVEVSDEARQDYINDTLPQFGQAQGFHDFDMINENGQNVGSINISEQKGGKELYVDNINGLGQYYHPNNFGPALLRDLLRQIKQHFPNAETLTGHRVSGARGLAGTYEDSRFNMPRIRLDDNGPQGWQTANEPFSDLLGGAWHSVDHGLEAYIKPTKLFAEHEQELHAAVSAELDRIVPKDVIHAPVLDIRGTDRPRNVTGMYYGPHLVDKPIILWSMNADDALGVARHEAIHHLRQAGFFTPEDWDTLSKASDIEGWQEKYRIPQRYARGSSELKIEESVAEAYRYWAEEFEDRQRQPGFALSPIDKIFQKLKDLLDAIKAHVRRITGTENFDDLFQRVHSGEVGSRDYAPGTELERGIATSEDLPIREPGQGIDPRSPFRAAKDVGMTIDVHKRYMKGIEARQQADLKASVDRIKAEQAKRQSAEWKAQGEAMRPQVLSDLNARPDVAADKFFGLGELMGQKLDKIYRLDWDALTPEQRKAIPESYTVRKGGVKPDDVAHLFGYPTGDTMIEGLNRITQAREASGLRRDRFQRQMVDNEIQRRMETEHGFLEKNIEEDTKDQVLSENQLDLLHEETHHLAMMSGEKGFDLTREQLTSAIKEKFDALPVGAVSSDKFLKEAGKHGKLAELSLLQDKPADAFKSKQVQYYNTIYAKMALQVEKAKAKLDKAARPYRKVEPPGNVEPEYVNHIQDLLQQAGYKVGRSIENIQENLGRRGQTLEQFADAKYQDSLRTRDIPIADVIVDGKVQPVDQMSTYDFMDFKQTIDALIKNGKDEKKIIKEGETVDRKELINSIKKEITDRFQGSASYTDPKSMWDGFAKMPRQFVASSVTMETFGRKITGRNPIANFMKYVVYRSFDADNYKTTLLKEFAKEYLKLGEIPNEYGKVVNPFLDPSTMKPAIGFTRHNLQAVVHNFGNDSNIRTLTASFIDPATMKQVTPEKLRAWVEAVATPDMWDRAQQLGNIFNKSVALADNLYERMNGFTIDKIPLKPFSIGGKNYEGWYHPLIEDPLRKGDKDLKAPTSDFGRLSTSNGYARKRTGAKYPLDLNLNMIPARMTQELHDIAYREFVAETQKIFKDSGLNDVLTTHLGAEYNGKNFLMPWLTDLAGKSSMHSEAMSMLTRLSDKMRSNVVGNYIGFNPYTAGKHTFTAAAFSMFGDLVGPKYGSWAMNDLYGKAPSITQPKHDFIMQSSDEIRRRNRHWLDSIYGAHNELEGEHGFREQVQAKGTWTIAKGDMFSSKYTWWGAYNRAKDLLDSDHGEAVQIADSAVRQAHGTIAAPGQPAFLRGGGPLNSWLTGVYGFMGTRLQRMLELGQDIHDTYKLGTQVGINKAIGNIPGILGNAAVFAIWPIMVEEAVNAVTVDDHRTWLKHAFDSITMGTASSLLYFRDVVHGLVEGNDIGVGLISSALNDIVKVKQDVRPDMFTKQRMGKTLGDTLTLLGDVRGIAPKTIDEALHFGIDLFNGQSHPKGVGDWIRGITRGNIKPRELK